MLPQKVVMDTDFGTDADDAIAVALAMASDETEVQAFTVVGRQSIYRKQMLENFLSINRSLGSTSMQITRGGLHHEFSLACIRLPTVG